MRAARRIFLSVNLHWWREPELRQFGQRISALETAAICTFGRRKQRARSSEARAQVGAPRRPVLGWGICRDLGVPVAGRLWVLWVTRRRVCTVGWYGGAGACEERAVEAPPGVTRKLVGVSACGGFVMVVPAFCWSCGIMEVEAAGGCGGLAPCMRRESERGRNPSQVAGYGPPAFRIITSYRESEPASGATDEGRGGALPITPVIRPGRRRRRRRNAPWEKPGGPSSRRQRCWTGVGVGAVAGSA